MLISNLFPHFLVHLETRSKEQRWATRWPCYRSVFAFLWLYLETNLFYPVSPYNSSVSPVMLQTDCQRSLGPLPHPFLCRNYSFSLESLHCSHISTFLVVQRPCLHERIACTPFLYCPNSHPFPSGSFCLSLTVFPVVPIQCFLGRSNSINIHWQKRNPSLTLRWETFLFHPDGERPCMRILWPRLHAVWALSNIPAYIFPG